MTEIEREIIPGKIIPKPQGRADFIVKGWEFVVADAIVEHLESHNWRIEQGPAREGHGPRADGLGRCLVAH